MSEDNKLTIEGLGTITKVHDATDDKPALFSMSNSELMKFYSEHGVPNPKEVLGAVQTANKDLAVACGKFIGEQMTSTLKDCELHCGTDANRIDFIGDVHKTVRDIRTGETSDKFGTITMKMRAKAPITDPAFEKIREDVEKAWNKNAGI